MTIDPRRRTQLLTSIASGATPETTWLQPLSDEEKALWSEVSAEMDQIVARGGYVDLPYD